MKIDDLKDKPLQLGDKVAMSHAHYEKEDSGFKEIEEGIFLGTVVHMDDVTVTISEERLRVIENGFKVEKTHIPLDWHDIPIYMNEGRLKVLAHV